MKLSPQTKKKKKKKKGKMLWASVSTISLSPTLSLISQYLGLSWLYFKFLLFFKMKRELGSSQPKY